MWQWTHRSGETATQLLSAASFLAVIPLAMLENQATLATVYSDGEQSRDASLRSVAVESTIPATRKCLG